MTVKKARKPKVKLEPLPKLEARLWKVFSVCVRVMHSTNGVCTCVTCGKKSSYIGGSIHAGHFQPRTKKFTKYEFTNVHPQCATCNTYNDGEQYLHGLYIDRKYGDGTALRITNEARKTFKDEGIDFREYLLNKLEECYSILSLHLQDTRWQGLLTKKELNYINGLLKK